ncbi:TRAP transporter large permease [Salicibibacter cibarius]|uniref:TRAP transporter large permease n=1 Tax=Salicibibacter cibarius TaxID=2743000 RepID=A0A7T7CAC1_9BACI|nr:TRAP transporter large permease [Salicibibacter cibarius]QQK74705.1 TRAP transporter large permease [Salicibibacter cibarius]
MILTLIFLALLMLFIGVPIFIALALSTFIVIIIFTDFSPLIIIQQLFGGIDQFVLMALPFFILAAYAMDVGGLSDRIIRFTKALVSHINGGVAMVTQSASMFFGALSGSSPATVVAIGKIMYPEMLRQGYSKSFSSGLIVQSGSLSLIFPPSITLILYASATGTSVGDLFMAGIGAGVVFGISMLSFIYFYSRIKGYPKNQRATWKELIKATRDALWAIAIPIIILGGIFSGIFTPTEAAGVAAIYSILIGMFVYREITLRKLYEVCLSTAITSAQVMILIAAASGLGWLLTVGQVPQMLASFLTENFSTTLAFLIVLNVILLLIGMFVDSTVALIVIAPLVLPGALALGVDPIHLGIIMVVNLAIGTFTPPFGLNIFVGQSITNLGIHEMVPGIIRFIIVALIILLIITFVPSISTFLPELMHS